MRILPIVMMPGRLFATSGACIHSRGPNWMVVYTMTRSMKTQGTKARVSAKPGG